MTAPHFLTRVVLHNYKSIAACDVRLTALNYMVGENGAGKSNFLDALALVAEALNGSLDQAISERWGMEGILHRGPDAGAYFGIRLEWALSGGQAGHYAFEVRQDHGGGYRLSREECVVGDRHFNIVDHQLISSTESTFPAVTSGRLALVAASGLPAFRPMFDALSAVTVYNFSPKAMRELQPLADGRILRSNGGNLVAVLRRMQHETPDAFALVQEYLCGIAPSVREIVAAPVGATMGVLAFGSAFGSHRFFAPAMSDGTVRALGVLVALFQGAPGLVCLEEPENALHPGAFAYLREAFTRAAQDVQVVVTSHSPELLDDLDLEPAAVLAVSNENGATRLGGLDEGSRSVLKERLFSAGELLRLNQLAPVAAAQELPELWGGGA